ncbi:MAG: IS200/IS605 family transposase [Armatimonadota bacterium]|nr:IS200/IS605 family transposase [Armatimonadota bacterium]
MKKARGVVRRRRSKVETYYHIVWATRGREERLTPEIERRVHRCVTGEVERLRCLVLALDGMPDHVHLVVRAPGNVCPAALAKQVKGVSSAMLNDGRGLSDELFRW